MTTCDLQSYRSSQSALAMQHLLLTSAVVVLFVCTKSYVNQLRRQHARCVTSAYGLVLVKLVNPGQM